MPNGERRVVGGQVIIERIGREDGGEYQCWDLLTNTTNIHKYVEVLCKYLYNPTFLAVCYRHVNGPNYTLISFIFYKQTSLHNINKTYWES